MKDHIKLHLQNYFFITYWPQSIASDYWQVPESYIAQSLHNLEITSLQIGTIYRTVSISTLEKDNLKIVLELGKYQGILAKTFLSFS